MRKAGFLFVTSIIALVIAKQVHAGVTVNSVQVSTSTGNGSDASSSVKSTTNSSSTTTTTSTSNTHVRIETNGQVKEYDSSNGEDVHVSSDDGNSKVDITYGDSTGSIATTPKPTKVDDGKDATRSAKHEEKKNIKIFPFDLRSFFQQLFARIFGR